MYPLQKNRIIGQEVLNKIETFPSNKNTNTQRILKKQLKCSMFR